MWIFFFVMFATIFVAVEAHLEMHSGFWKLSVTVFLLMPLTCLMKSMIGKASEQANEATGHFGRNYPIPPFDYIIGAEDVALCLFAIVCVWHLFEEAEREGEDPNEVSEAFNLAIESFLVQMVAEIPTLVWKYFFCRFCCCCCCCWQDAQGDTRTLADLHAEHERMSSTAGASQDAIADQQQPILDPSTPSAV